MTIQKVSDIVIAVKKNKNSVVETIVYRALQKKYYQNY